MSGHDDVGKEAEIFAGVLMTDLFDHGVAFFGRECGDSRSQIGCYEKHAIAVGDAAQARHAGIVAQVLSRCVGRT